MLMAEVKVWFSFDDLCRELHRKTGFALWWVREQIAMDDDIVFRKRTVSPSDWMSQYDKRLGCRGITKRTKDNLLTLYYAYADFLMQEGLTTHH